MLLLKDSKPFTIPFVSIEEAPSETLTESRDLVRSSLLRIIQADFKEMRLIYALSFVAVGGSGVKVKAPTSTV